MTESPVCYNPRSMREVTEPRARLRLDHRPRAREERRVPFSFLVKAGFFALGIPRGALCSIDVTARCNLRCRHCYFLEQGYDPASELSVEAWVEKLEQLTREAGLRRHFAYQCSWVGGEPLLRAELVERGRRFFPYNIVVTNGLLPLPSWPDVHFFVSVDGTEEAHEAIRGVPGSYRRIKHHAEREDLDVMVTCCLNRLNAHTVEELTAEWDRTPVRHIAFEFHTPIAGLAGGDDLWLTLEERDRVLEVILALKEVYGSFILPPARTYRLMRSDVCQEVTRTCDYARIATAFGPDGEVKRPCMLGPKAECSRCGCIVPFVTRAQVDRRRILGDLWTQGRSRLARLARPAGRS
jgi:Fe-coproporphyrin III synthase